MGMNNITGQRLEGVAWLNQRLADVLTTPLGTRLMRREYGSRLLSMLDQPMSSRWKVQMYAAIVEAIDNPVNGLADFQVAQARLTTDTKGKAELDLWGVYTPTGQLVKLESIKVAQ